MLLFCPSALLPFCPCLILPFLTWPFLKLVVGGWYWCIVFRMGDVVMVNCSLEDIGHSSGVFEIAKKTDLSLITVTYYRLRSPAIMSPPKCFQSVPFSSSCKDVVIQSAGAKPSLRAKFHVVGFERPLGCQKVESQHPDHIWRRYGVIVAVDFS